jgi:hypothetical protein
MRKSAGAIVTLCMFLIAFVSSMAGYIFGVQAGKENAVQEKTVKYIDKNAGKEDVVNQSAVEKKSEVDTVDYRINYVLREYEGKIALFQNRADGKEEIYKIYEISIGLLPQSDREELKAGIETESLSEALQLVEDYL